MPYVTEDNLTDVVLERWNDITDPRLRQIMQSLIKQSIENGFQRDRLVNDSPSPSARVNRSTVP